VSRLVVGPFNRVEGDLEVTLETEAGRVQAAYVNSPLFRGFEHLLQGRDPLDALTLVARICGICSVAHSAAASAALADAMGLLPAANGRVAANLVLAAENLADHLTHFYLFFMPDFAREHYADRPWYPQVAERFRALTGSGQREMLAARAELLHLVGQLAGKWPHTLALQPGGTTRALDATGPLRLAGILRRFRRFLEQRLFGDRLERVAELTDEAALSHWTAGSRGPVADFPLFLAVAAERGLAELGRGGGLFLSFGAYPQGAERLFPAGVWRAGERSPLDLSLISEDLSHAWLAGPAEPLAPTLGVTVPLEEKAGAYSWCKAPRLAGQPAETGALARQVVAGHPLALGLAAAGGDVYARVVARLLELALLVPQMERWVDQLEAGAPYCQQGRVPAEASGVGLVEAARGSLGHWLTVKGGRIARYQIIAPTTWNFSPRDASGTPGPLEQALVGTPIEPGVVVPLAVQHVVRSFDPCMVCTVH